MGTLLWVGWTNLRRDRVAQMLTFLLPIVFFSIFATVFGGQGDVSTARIRIAVVDEDRSEVSARLINGLKNEKGLRTQTTADAAGAARRPRAAERLVKNGDVPVAGRDSAGMVMHSRRTGSLVVVLDSTPVGRVRSDRSTDGARPAAESRDDRGARSADARRHAAVRELTRAP
jgi:ABC-type Na+ efflux pump permease subunit